MDLQQGLGQVTCIQLLLCEKEQVALAGRQLSTSLVLPWTRQSAGLNQPYSTPLRQQCGLPIGIALKGLGPSSWPAPSP